MKIFSAQLKGTTIVVSGSSASITGSFTGSIAGIDINATNTFTASTIARLSSIETISSSNNSRVNSLEAFSSSIFTTNTFTSSTSARLNSIETISASNLSRLNSIETITASNIARLTSLESTSASVDTLNTTQNSRLTSLEIKTGSLATTGSNFFSGSQTITGSLYISADLIVQGSSSLQNITASAVSIGTNIINLNTANPAIRYAGLSIGDSGSIGSSGSFLYDSVQDEMIFIHRGANTTVTSSVVLMGPQTFDNIGSETYPTNNRIQKGTGNEHLVDSCISDTGTLVTISSVTSSFSGLIGIGMTAPESSLHIIKALGNDVIKIGESAANTRFAIGQEASYTGNYINSRNIDLKLQAYCAGGSGGNIHFQTGTDGTGCVTTKMFICSNGNIGIGTTTPASTYGFSKSLVVSNPANAEISLEATTCSKVLSIGVTDGFNYFQTTSGNGYDFQIGGGSKMRMTSAGITTFVCQVCISVARTNGANSTALILQDNVTGIQTPGFGLRLVYQSNGTGVQSVIGLENGNTGTNNESQISFYTQNTAGGLSKRLLIDASGIACFSGVVCAASFGQIKGDSTSDVHSFTNDNAGNTHFCNRYGRLLTTNGAGWSTDGRDPIMALVGSYSCTSRGLSIGLALHNDNNTTNAYSPMIAFSALSNSSGYNSTYASIMGKKTGTASGLDTNWNKGELHFYAHGENYMADTPTMILSSVGVTKPFQPFVYGGLASDQSITTSNPTKVNFVANTGHFGCNVGSNWNNSTNQFTAPITGVYLVNLSGYWSANNMINQFAAFVNNARKVSIPTSYCTLIAGGSMMVPMASGETMDFRVYNDTSTGTLYSNVYHTFFSIYLL